MLTIILLVILAGGAGVVAISVAEKQHPATDLPAGHRGAGRDADAAIGTPPATTDHDLVDDGEQAADHLDREPDEITAFASLVADRAPVTGRPDGNEVATPFDGEVREARTPTARPSVHADPGRTPERTGPAPVTAALPALERPGATPLDLLPRRADAANAPRRRVAVEGPLAAVARRSVFRRARSVVALATLSVAAGIVLAVTAGVTAVVVGSLLDRAIG